jgi:hypothetical protein
MCQTLIVRVPEHLAALRDALRDQDAPRLREAAHKCCDMLSEFSAAAGDLAGRLEDRPKWARQDPQRAEVRPTELRARAKIKSSTWGFLLQLPM